MSRNYKPVIRKIIMGNVETEIPNEADVVVLTDPTNVVGAVDSMTNINTHLVFTVQTGQTFHLLGIRVFTEALTAVNTLTIHEGATENAQTVEKLIIDIVPHNPFIQEFSVKETFDSAKYVVIDPSAANISYIYMVGYQL